MCLHVYLKKPSFIGDIHGYCGCHGYGRLVYDFARHNSAHLMRL